MKCYVDIQKYLNRWDYVALHSTAILGSNPTRVCMYAPPCLHGIFFHTPKHPGQLAPCEIVLTTCVSHREIKM